MSTRYVYDIYDTTASANSLATEASVSASATYNVVSAVLCNAYHVEIAYNRANEPVPHYVPDGDASEKRVITPSNTGTGNYDVITDTYKYKYAILTCNNPPGDGSIGPVLESYLLEFAAPHSGAYWHVKPTGRYLETGAIYVWNNDSNAKDNKDNLKSFYKGGGSTLSQGTRLKIESSSTQLTDGFFEHLDTLRYRSYKGSDTIDPTAVTYSKTELYPGDTVTITVSARTPTYGGTVYYQYQYTTDGTTWVNLGGRTTSTTASFTVPEDAEHFQARVLASDGWGFTSTTYVNGPSLGVSQLKAYGTVSGTIRALKKGWCVVGGTVKSLERGYVTVNGVWKKIF